MDNRECIEKREPFIIFAENVDKFNLGNRTCIPQSESRALEKEGEKNGRSECRRKGNEFADLGG